MQVVETKNEGLSREFKITLGADDIDARVEGKLTEVGKTVNLPGFRPGKVPMTILRQRFGNAVLGEVLEAAVGESSQSVLAERALKPAMQPKIEIDSFDPGSDLIYTMGVEVMPDIEPVDFSTLDLKVYKPEIAEEEVDNAIGELAKNQRPSQKIEEDRETKTGDVILLDFEGSVDGVPFEGGQASDFNLELGGGRFIPGFEDQLVGYKAGADVTVNVKFPDEYGAENLAGKDAVFACTIKEIQEFVDREADDEFAKELGLESLDDLKQQMRGRLEGEYMEVARARTKRELLDVLFDKHDFEVPPGMIESEFNQIWEQFEKARDEGQVDEDDKEKDEDTLKGEYGDIAKRRVLLGLLLSHVGDQANVQVTQEEMQREVFKIAQRYPGQEQQVFQHYTQNPDMMAGLRAPIFEEKTVDYILELAKTEDVMLPVDQLLNVEEDGGEEKPTKKTKAKKAAKKSSAKKSGSKKAAAKKADDA